MAGCQVYISLRVATKFGQIDLLRLYSDEWGLKCLIQALLGEEESKKRLIKYFQFWNQKHLGESSNQLTDLSLLLRIDMIAVEN